MSRSWWGSKVVKDLAILSNSAVGRVRMIPTRKMTFNRGLEALTVLLRETTHNSTYIVATPDMHEN